MSVGSMHAHTWYDRENPDVSIVILNLNKADLTAECLSHLWRHTAGRRYEIVVVDNGSSHDEFRKLAAVRGPMHLVRLDENRYFGEGNNIGFARSRGRFVVFLNNDAFVTQGWLAPLIDLLETRPDAGGVGPRFVYPDHRLQEAGAFVDDEAHAIQIGKFDIYDEADIGQERIVDYCSAACLAVRREIFEWVGGFDYMYEPAYYEDVDLCMKIAALGLFVYYCPQTTIVHIENATSRENRERLGLHNIVEINRRKFLSRWGQWLTDRANNRPAALPTQFAPAVRRPADGVAGGPKAVFYTPYNLIPGGGERYLLTAAVAAAARYDVYLATEHPYSDLRIASLGRDFAVDTSHIKTIARMDLPRLGAVEYSVIMSNELLPPFPGFGRRNLYVCQFPFPIGSDTFASRWGNLDAIDEVVVYSGFVEENVRRRLNEVNLGHKRIRVIHPPVNPIQVRAPSRSSEGPFKVILIGRFFAGGHNKRHDVAIEAVRRLVADNFPVELHLVGSLHSEPVHRAYYRELERMAADLPVTFHPDASRETIEELLGSCHLYWHATGFEVDARSQPERCEHFGISPLEAMSAGCVPLVAANGGPLEFVTDQINGYTFATIPELIVKTKAVLADPALFQRLSAQAQRDAADFSEEVFMTRWRALLGALVEPALDMRALVTADRG